MCTRYTLASGVHAIENELQAEFQFTWQKRYQVHFGLEAPVILSEAENKLVALRWGLVPFWAREPNYKFHNINASARNIVKHNAYRVPVRRRRCLVPANCYFVWVRGQGGKQPHVVYDAGQRIMTFAGIWEEWRSADRLELIRSFAIVTTHANQRLRPYCGEMPVIIPPGRRRKYLRIHTPLNEVMRMLRPLPSDTINLYPVSGAVNNFDNNQRDIILPVGERRYKEYTYVPKVYLKLEGMGASKDNPDRKPEIKLML